MSIYVSIYLYVYIERESETEGERETQRARARERGVVPRALAAGTMVMARVSRSRRAQLSLLYNCRGVSLD